MSPQLFQTQVPMLMIINDFYKWIWTSAHLAWDWCIQKGRSQISITKSEWNHKATLHWFLIIFFFFFRFSFIFYNSFLDFPFQNVSREIVCCFHLTKHMALLPKDLFGVALFQLFIIPIIPGVQVCILTTGLFSGYRCNRILQGSEANIHLGISNEYA